MSNLKDIRKEKGLSQDELGAKVGLRKSTISKYESGETMPSSQILISLSKELHCSTDYLLNLTTFKNQSPDSLLPDDELLLIKCYKRISKSDKRVLWALLDKYVPATDIDKMPNQ